MAGLWHDLGKYQDAFQRHLLGEKQQVDHGAPGAALADRRGAKHIAFVIAGHHGGMADRSGDPLALRRTPLEGRLERGLQLLAAIQADLPTGLTGIPMPELPARFSDPPKERAFRSYELWTRFLYSCLVDADFLDTEEFMKPGKRRGATTGMASVGELRDRLDRHLGRISEAAAPTALNELRAQILASCRERAAEPPGIFSLTVPTGGGKTLSGMAFALEHAVRYHKDRVIVAIPFTSIIDQNAAVYREAFGDVNVIEHHSNLDPERETVRNRLASESWDAPIIVTTNVQLFESLFASQPSRCRKLHNVANSVIVLDEAQSLPAGYLHAILEVIGELERNYGCTIVLSTATQPAFRYRQETLPIGFKEITEIAPDPPQLFAQLRRVEVDWQRLTGDEVTWEELAAEAAGLRQVLLVVHRRDDARRLAELLPEEGRYHLSALMCAKHRKEVIDRVRAALAAGETCRLVSTQLIEAGVDVDFPQVYRALGGLDSVAQAAGRCNREGRARRGRVVLFRAPTAPPCGTPTKALEVTTTMLAELGGEIDISDPDVYEQFFRGLYQTEDLDAKQVQTARQELGFETVASKVRLINEMQTRAIVVPYGDAEQRLEELRKEGPDRERLRALQPYLVTVYDNQYRALDDAKVVEKLPDSDKALVLALVDGSEHLYDQEYGLSLHESVAVDPMVMIQ